jgi:hypothetical protein
MYDDLAPPGDLLREVAPPDDAGALRFRRTRDLGDVVNVTFRFLRENARELGLGLLVVVGPVALVAAALSAWAQLQMAAALAGPLDPANPEALFESAGYAAGLGVTVLVTLFMQLLIQAVVLGYVERYRRGEAGALPPTEVWEATKAAFGPVLSTTLLGLGLFLGFFVAASALAVAVPALGFVAMLAGLVGAVYLFPILTLLYVERVAERDGFREGFERTRDLVRGQWWPTFGVLFVSTLVAVVVMLVLAIPGSLVQAVASFNTLDGEGAPSVAAVAVGALFGVLVYAAYAIPTVAAAFQYFNLVERKEGAGLLAELDALGARPAPDVPPVPPRPRAWRPEPEAPPAGSGFRGGGFSQEPGDGDGTA